MKKTITAMIMMVVTLVMSAQSPVELTPFKEAVDNYTKGVEQVLEYAKSIGYTERYRQHDDTTIYKYDNSMSIKRIRSAYNPTDHSCVVIWSNIDNNACEGEDERLVWVSYYWPKKKMMPKGLPKIEHKRVRDKYDYAYFTITSGKYKNNYIMSIIGNQLKGSGGFNILHTFSAIINGEYVDGSWLE